MEMITIKQFVAAPIVRVWETWDDFGHIDRFSPAVRESRLLGDGNAPVGPGTRRECELDDGKNWLREEIVEYTPQKTLVTNVYESSLPIDSMRSSLRFRALDEERTEILLTTEFEPRRGLVGKLTAPFVRRQFRPLLNAMLVGNAAYVERGMGSDQAAA